MTDLMHRVHEIVRSMSSRRRVAVLAAVALLIAVGAGVFAATQRFFPVLVVNGKMISARRVDRNVRAAAAGYERMRSAYGLADATTTAIEPEEMERRVLDQLVDAVLVDQAVRREVGSELPSLVAAKVGKYTGNDRLSDAAEKLYGMPFRVFVDEVLVPQAERDILSGRLFLKGEKFPSWLAAARRDASVAILSGRFRWDEGTLSRASRAP